MKQSNLLNAQFARRLFRTAFSSWQLLAVMLIVCMNVAVGSKLYAQSNTIAVKGKVMADGEPVIGATVLVKGVSTGTATDMDGNFSLNVASKAVLVVSSIGYETQEVPVNGRQFINVVLKSDVVTLKDVVVVGYGVQKKVNLTGAVSSVSTDELEGKPISNVLEAMQGTTPGLVIQQGSSTPGSVPSINIRGLNTMNNNDPLVIIDGIEGSLGNLNPADIEQISILKDASSTAIYGSRASNGVVLVTTKKGKAGKVEISYDFMYGVQQPTSLPKIADSWVYAELYNEAAVNSGRAAKFTPEQIAQFRNGGPNVNWVKELYHRNSPQSSHNVSMTGGNDQLSYMASLGYMDQNSMFKGPDYGYKRYNARLNVSHKVTNNFTLNLTSQFARNDIKEHAYWTEWIIEQANRMPPIYPIKNEDGSYNYPAGSNSNGLQRLEEGGYRQNVNDELLGTIQAEWEVYKGLKLIGSAGGRVWNNNLHENRKAFEGTGDSENKLTEQFYRSKNITTNLMVTYNTKIGKHSIGGLLGYAYEGFSEKQFSTSRLTEDSKYDIFVGDLSGDKVSNGGSASDWAIYSGFARATYNYDEKYLFSGSLRYEGSSKFGKNHQWGLFYAASGAWRISQEKFMRNVKFVNELKLKVGYGVTGIEPTNPYQSHLRYAFGDPVLINGQWVRTVAPTENANPDLKWEEKHELNIGLDFALFKNRLSGSIDYYRRETRDLLYTYNVPVPPNLASTTLANVGTVENSGVEAVLSGLVVNNRDWKLNLTANFSYNTNKLKKLSNEKYQRDFLELGSTGAPVQKSTHLVKEGGAIGNFYGWKSIGMTESGEWVIEGGEYGDNSSRTVLGNGIPTMRAGFTAALSYKNFDLTVSLRGAFDYQILNQYRMLYETFEKGTQFNYPKTLLDKVYGQYVRKSPAYVSYYIENGDYVKIDNVTLGYNFKLKSSVIQNLRVYLSGLNLYTFTGYKGVDPEVNFNGLTPGMDSYTGYPTTRTFSLGVKIGF